MESIGASGSSPEETAGSHQASSGQHNDEASFHFFGSASFESVGSTTHRSNFTSPLSCGPQVHSSILESNNSRAQYAKQYADDSDCSLGDISPIRFPHGSGGTSQTSNVRNSNQNLYWCAHNNQLQRSQEVVPGVLSNPFYVLRSSRNAFHNCRYLLTATRDDNHHPCTVNISCNGHIQQYKEEGSLDWKLASRRVETAVIAFGGRLFPAQQKLDPRPSIFRRKQPSKHKQTYECLLPNRYHIGGSMVSWDVEDAPPIQISDQNEIDVKVSPGSLKLVVKPDSSSVSPVVQDSTMGKNPDVEGELSAETREELSKMKYRCKLCGQLKQNHDCPNRRSLHRSIGVMVYPAVNSFTAAEPGLIAPALTKMNNFVSYDSDQCSPKPDYMTPQGSLPTQYSRSEAQTRNRPPSHISPESRAASAGFFSSPQSSLSNQSEEAMAGADTHGCRGVKRTLSSTEFSVHGAALAPVRPSVFVNAVSLRPEHYRAVTAATENETNSHQDDSLYQYPVIPLTFAERKRLSDTLFYLSSGIPQVAREVAELLHNARQTVEWDFAVAELLTQVVVAIYCSEDDYTLEGLRQYLLALGISC